MADAVVRLQALDGTWETCGADRASGVWPENVTLTEDDAGCKSASFELHRNPGVQWPDIGAFTPVIVDVDGAQVWSGRVIETPVRDGREQVLAVQCEGWQHQLDDDLYERVYVHNRLSEWQDTRTFLSAPLGNFNAGAIVQQTGNTIVLGWPTGFTTVQGTSTVGVTIDFGRSVTYPTSGSLTVAASTFSAGAFTIYLKGHDDLATIISGGSNACSQDATTVGSMNGNANRAYRYWSILVHKTAGGTFTETTDRVLRISNALVVTDNAYRSGNTSVLKASTVITDALSRGTVKLNADRSGIAATSFNIPELAPSSPVTPREVIDGVNAYHGWQFKVDAQARPVFRARPTVPLFQVGSWSAMEFEDASANSGRDIYNRVTVVGETPAGEPLRVTRTAIQAQGVDGYVSQSDLSISNPSFATDTAGWSAADGGVITRTTTAGEYDSAPAGLKLANAGGANTYTTLAGTARAGATYVAIARIRASTFTSINVWLGPSNSASVNDLGLTLHNATTSWDTVVVSWTPRVATVSPVLGFINWDYGNIFIDSLEVRAATRTLPDRRGFVRGKTLQAPMSLPSDGAAAQAIADAWLANHSTTPFRGTITLTGNQTVRNRKTAIPVPLHHLIGNTGELIELTDRADPDTGAATRTGRIAEISYRPQTDEATITLDNNRAGFDQLLARLAVIAGTP